MRDRERAAAALGQRLGEPHQLIGGGEPAGHGLAPGPGVGGLAGGREADRAGVEGLADEPPHLLDLGRGGIPLGRLLAQHVQPQRGVAEHDGHVQLRPGPLDRVQVLGEGLEGPGDAREQRLHRHALDVLQRPRDRLPAGRPGRGDAEPAVAHHHRGHAVPRRGGEVGVPQHLRVIVGVAVDESRGQHQAVQVDDVAVPGHGARRLDRGDPVRRR